MWLLANGPVPFSDGVCAFLGNEPSLLWLGKSKPFMLWSGKISRVRSTRGYLLVCGVKKGKKHCILKVSQLVRFHCESHTPRVL